MRYKLLGRSGLRVSEIALGTLNFGETKDWGVSAEDAARLLGIFADHGGTFIDTAPNYAAGAAETIVGKAIAENRDRFVVATKYTASNNGHVLAGGNSTRTMIQSIEASLKRLGTEHIDLLWLHFWDGTTPIEEILRGFDALYAAGKVRYVGLSDVPAWIASRAVTMAELRGWLRPVAVQVEYSLAARDAEREFLPMADALDLGVVGWGALAAGALSGGANPMRRKADKVPSSIRQTVDRVEEILSGSDTDLPAAALQWILQAEHAQSVVPLIGARQPVHLTQTLSAVHQDLDAELIKNLTEATAPVLGFPHNLLASSYLQRFAMGKDNEFRPYRPRA